MTDRITKRDMVNVLRPAELNIAKFQPPSANLVPQLDPNTPPPPPNLERIQQEVAEKSAQERADALFDFLIQLIAQTCKDEIDRQNVISSISTLRAELDRIQGILSRHNLT
jgi:hypothetical protein